MEAMRSVLTVIGHRCGFSRSSAAASMGGRKVEILKVFHNAPLREPPPLRTAAVRNLESWRAFSTAGREPTDKPECSLRMWWQWARNRVKNANAEERAKALFVYSSVGLGHPRAM